MSWNGKGQRDFFPEEEDAPKGCLGSMDHTQEHRTSHHFPLLL